MRSGAPEAREQVQWTCESDERRELGRAAVPSPAHVRKTVGGRGWSGLEFKLSIVSPEFHPSLATGKTDYVSVQKLAEKPPDSSL